MSRNRPQRKCMVHLDWIRCSFHIVLFFLSVRLMSTYWYWVDGERKQNESESEQDETREAGQAADQDKETVWRII